MAVAKVRTFFGEVELEFLQGEPWENDLRMVGFPTWYPRRHLHFQRFEQQKLGVTDERIGWEN